MANLLIILLQLLVAGEELQYCFLYHMFEYITESTKKTLLWKIHFNDAASKSPKIYIRNKKIGYIYETFCNSH